MVAVGDETLAERLRATGMLAPEDAAALLGQVATELAAMHAAGSVHGNVSPSTVLVGPDGSARLTHVGSADEIEPDSIPYLAPEAVDGGPATKAGDLWALGATLYAAVEGAPPFPGGTTDEILQGIRRDPIPPSLRGRGVSWVIALLLSREPVGRLRAQEVAEALGAMTVRSPDREPDPEPVVEAAPEPAPERVPEPVPAQAPEPVVEPVVTRKPVPARSHAAVHGAAHAPARPAVHAAAHAPAHPPAHAGVAAADQSSTGWLLLLAASVVAITLLLVL